MRDTASDADSEDRDVELGKKEFWEACYEKELVNLQQHDDEGEVWFGEEVLKTVVSWCDSFFQQHLGPSARQQSVLDIGTGNASFLVALAARGYTSLTGSDYSKASIQLAKAVLQKHGLEGVELVVDDVLDSQLERRFRVIADKGTLDAIGLTEDAASNRRRYKESVWTLLEPNGYLVITSCNSTRDELISEVSNDASCAAEDGQSQAKFIYIDHVKTYPTFRYAGIEGTRVATVAFQRTD